jgi:hypothetical protein
MKAMTKTQDSAKRQLGLSVDRGPTGNGIIG